MIVCSTIPLAPQGTSDPQATDLVGIKASKAKQAVSYYEVHRVGEPSVDLDERRCSIGKLWRPVADARRKPAVTWSTEDDGFERECALDPRHGVNILGGRLADCEFGLEGLPPSLPKSDELRIA
jgi:hypothetical protein